jgi:hypothetical protein
VKKVFEGDHGQAELRNVACASKWLAGRRVRRAGNSDFHVPRMRGQTEAHQHFSTFTAQSSVSSFERLLRDSLISTSQKIGLDLTTTGRTWSNLAVALAARLTC